MVVAVSPIERGATLKPAMLKVVNYPKDAVPAGAYASVDLLAGDKPRMVDRALAANEPLLASKLVGSGANNLSGTLTPGMRAVSVKSDNVNGVGGFVMPGDRVDILVTRQTGDSDKPVTVTQVLSENSLVMGVDQTSDRDTDKPIVAKAVTVEVTPEQAQAISLAQSLGQITLTLRQRADAAPLAKKATTISDLAVYGVRKAPVARAVARPSAPQVRVTRGVETTGYSVSGSSL